jgi:hypothetical protein
MSSPVPAGDPFPQGVALQYDAQLESLRDKLKLYLATAWAQAAILLQDNTLEQVLSPIISTVEATQFAAANLTSAYLAAATDTAPMRVLPDVTRRESGVAKNVVYRRAFRQFAIEMNKPGISDQKAEQRALRRLQSIAATDVQMAVVRQSQSSLKAAKRKHYRRIPTGRESCALCLIAATQRYNTADLLPIHGGCDCLVGPIPPGMDLDLVIDEQMLEDTHQRVKEFAALADRGGRMPDYRKLIISHEHGEIGPVIGWRGQNFTSAADLRNNGEPVAAL